nr:T9SS type A sorting domain-containing protein [Bacteroidota bacterium]
CGINAATLANAPTVTQLKMQQTANTNTFSNVQQNALVTLPATNSRIRFSPPATTPAPSGTITFTGVNSAGMTVNWLNWCLNEVGYVLYNSTDNITFTFVAQQPANSTNYIATGLLPSTLYYWRVYGVTEGALSPFITNSQSTTPGVNKVSVVTGNWNVSATWLPAGVPTTSDNVTIANGHIVTINTNAMCNNLTVGQGLSGTLRIGNDNTSRSLLMNGNITINTGATFSVPGTSNATHFLNLFGNIVNNGTLDFSADVNSICNVTFARNGNQTISGTALINRFNNIRVDLGFSASNTFEVSSVNFSAPANFLTLVNGTFKLSTTGTVVITPFSNTTTITNTTGININSPTATVNFGASVNLYGTITLTNGNLNIGNSINEDLISNGGIFQVLGGAATIAGKYNSPNINTLSHFTIAGGTLTLPVSNTNSATFAPFTINAVGSTFNMTGGSIIIEKEGGTGAQNLGFIATGINLSTVTGGTLQIGNAFTPPGQTLNINSTVSIGNLLVNSNNATARLLTNPLNVVNNVTINSGSLVSNNLNLTLGGNWLDLATFAPGTATVIFNGASAQSLTKAGGETFNHLIFSGAGTKTLGSAITTNGNITINAPSTLDVSASNFPINIRGDWINNGNFNAQSGSVNFIGALAQTLSGSGTTSFYQLDMNNSSGGVSISSGTYLLTSLIRPIAGVFNTMGNSFTMVSDASRTARISPITGSGSLAGNFIVQRYITTRDTSYADLSSPVQNATLNDWDNELPALSYVYNPPYEYPSVYTYNETGDSFTAVLNPAISLSPGRGFETFLAGDYFYASLPNTTMNTIGIPNQGNQNLSSLISNNAQGWNLVGNPFASSISWASVYSASGGAASGLYDFIEMYDYTIGDWNGYTSADAIEIGSGQGFWVYGLPGATTLTLLIPESSKTTASNSTIKAPINSSRWFNMTISSSQNSFRHTFHVNASPDASDNFDATDLTFRSSPNKATPAVYAEVEGRKLNLNSFNSFSESYTMPLTLKVNAANTYTFSFLGLDQLEEYKCIRLEDKLTNSWIDLRSTEQYEFHTALLFDKNRFVLHLKKDKDCEKQESSAGVALTKEEHVSVFPLAGGNQINFSYSGLTAVTVSLVDLLGQDLVGSKNLMVETNSEMIMLPPDFHGIYFVKVVSEKGTVVKKFFRK